MNILKLLREELEVNTMDESVAWTYGDFLGWFVNFVDAMDPANVTEYNQLARIYWETRILDFYHEEKGQRYYIGMNAGYKKIASDGIIYQALTWNQEDSVWNTLELDKLNFYENNYITTIRQYKEEKGKFIPVIK